MSASEHVDVRTYLFERRPGGGTYRTVKVRAGYYGKQRIVPPAGEDYAFEIDLWRRTVEVSVSPTGRSVRVFVDGKEIKP